MAITIKSIPILTKKAASNFQGEIEKNEACRSTIDFSKESSIADKILSKAKF